MLPVLMLAVVLEAPIGDAGATPLSWQAPAGCPDASAVRARIERLVGRSTTAAELRVEGVVTLAPGGFSLALHVESGGVIDDRVLVAERCEVLADTTALVAAVIVDPITTAVTVDVPGITAAAIDAVDDPTGTAREPSPLPRTRPREPVAIDRPARATPGPNGVWTRARVMGQLGAVPRFTGGFELAIAVGARRVRGELAGSYWLPRRVEEQGAALRVQLGTVTARVCGTLPQRRIDIALCGGPELGILRGDVEGGPTRLPLWIAVVAEGGVRVPVSRRVALWATIGAAVPVLFPRFRLIDPTSDRQLEVYRPASAGVRAGLGVEVRIRGVDPGPRIGRERRKSE